MMNGVWFILIFLFLVFFRIFCCELENVIFLCCFIEVVVLIFFRFIGVFLGEWVVIKGVLDVVFNWIFFIILLVYFGFLLLVFFGKEFDFKLLLIGGNLVGECL